MIERMKLNDDHALVSSFAKQQKEAESTDIPIMDPEAWLRPFDFWCKEHEKEIDAEELEFAKA